jgi:hypothetical protein
MFSCNVQFWKSTNNAYVNKYASTFELMIFKDRILKKVYGLWFFFYVFIEILFYFDILLMHLLVDKTTNRTNTDNIIM